MRILAVNWLDRENPQAGGAEVHFFEIFRRLVREGHSVTLVTSGWDGCEPEVTLDGIKVKRFGGRHTFAVKARRAVRTELGKGNYEAVVEDINKIPLYLSGVTSLPVYVIVPHLFGTTVFQEAPLPLATAVWLAEQPIPWAYRSSQFHVISRSTAGDLVERGIPPESIRVIYPGIDPSWFRPDPSVNRFERPTFLYVGRIKRYKGLDAAIEALARIRSSVPDISLLVAGSGDHRDRLQERAARFGLGDSVKFFGFVSEAEKRDLMRRAWAVILPSAKEGWGMTNVEAAACGTPAISSRSPGLRETVKDGETGALVPHGDVESLSREFHRFSSDPALVARMGEAARRFAQQFSWDEAASRTSSHIQETIDSTGNLAKAT